ncbi:YhgE/Pip family protein [Agathobacter sp.]
MKNILKIFKTDLKGICRNILVLVIVIGLCALPALYAWFNIYANWDPYGNTGNIAIAVVNLDEGWTKDDGTKVNMGDGVVESLKQKDTIGWKFLDSEEKAVEGVKSGKYYSALVIDEQFTYSMYHGVAQNIENPKITYYLNDKKNAVATKITDSAASTVKSSINKQFIQVLTEQIFTETNSISSEMSQKDSVDKFISKLEAVSDNLKQYDDMITTFMDGNAALSKVSDETSGALTEGQDKISQGNEKLSQSKSDLSSTQDSFNNFSTNIKSTLNSVESSINNISTQIGDAKLAQDAGTLQTDMKNISQTAQQLKSDIDGLKDDIDIVKPGDKSGKLDLIEGNIQIIKDQAQSILDGMNSVDLSGATENSVETLQGVLSTLSSTVSSLSATYSNQIAPQVNDMLGSMSTTLDSVQTTLNNLSQTAGSMSEVFDGVGNTLDVLNMSMSQFQGIIESASDKINSTLNKLYEASEDEKVEIIMNLLSGDPESLGRFFSEPVQVSDNYIYGIANYGSGVAPFYTTLAIWVGMTILVSLVKVNANTNGLVDPKPSQLYFGRYLTFFLLSQIQALIIVLGDLYILKIQCPHPAAFIATGAVTSLTFSLLIYSLTISFGDIGKAAAVVIMVIQIAGSGGTYPIEALPSFFRAVYIFFPFPYAINAMRECIGGMYENTLGKCYMQLLLFCAASLVIGLIVRKPFIRLNHFIEKRMEDTEML